MSNPVCSVKISRNRLTTIESLGFVLLVVVVVAQISVSEGFIQPTRSSFQKPAQSRSQPTRNNPKITYIRNFATPIDINDYNSADIIRMEELILSLSREQNDTIRREQVATIFGTELAKSDKEAFYFSKLFDIVVISIGDQVRQEAINQATQKQFQQQQHDVDESTDVTTTNPTNDQQLQIWALVDMMVQSKTIVKKARGQLGTEGKFG